MQLKTKQTKHIDVVHFPIYYYAINFLRFLVFVLKFFHLNQPLRIMNNDIIVSFYSKLKVYDTEVIYRLSIGKYNDLVFYYGQTFLNIGLFTR
jgi:hypothetical protein